MPTIKPISNLRNYSEVLDGVCPGSPVFLTKNGHGRYAILDMADYDRLIAAQSLFSELEHGRMSGDNHGWITSEDVRSHFENRHGNGA